MKPDCYECIHRGKVPGSAHSSCHHPAFKDVMDNPMAQVLGVFASVGRVLPIQDKTEKCKVVGDPRGIKGGWFNHPFNFDPVWLEECEGFTQKEGKHDGPGKNS